MGPLQIHLDRTPADLGEICSCWVGSRRESREVGEPHDPVWPMEDLVLNEEAEKLVEGELCLVEVFVGVGEWA